MLYDLEGLMSDIDFTTFVNFCIDELGYDVKPGFSSESGNALCVCHYHNDGKSSKKYGSTSLISRGNYKGIYCFACGTSKSLISMVMTEKSMHLVEAVKYICQAVGTSPDIYAIPGTETEWELEHKQNIPKDAKYPNFPAALTPKELKLIGIKKSAENYEVLQELTRKPELWELNEDESVIKKLVPNPKYIPGSLPEYKDFIFYIAGAKDYKGSCEDPFITKYLIVRKPKWSLISLYNEDKEAYWMIVMPKMVEAIIQREDIIQNSKSSFEKYNMQKELKILHNLYDKYFNALTGE